MLCKERVKEIDKDYWKIKLFDKDSILFLVFYQLRFNVLHLASHSDYPIRAKFKKEMGKWFTKHLFIELVEPSSFLYDSKSYFEKHKKIYGKALRKCIRWFFFIFLEY